jgi:hypothetical protein
MRVRLISYEDINEWILGKFVLRMQDDLLKMGIEADIAKVPDPTADINHHVIYEQFNGITSNHDTLMITHIDSSDKLNHLKAVINNVSYGICMSKDTMQKLVALGLPKEHLCYVDPAQDGDFVPRKIQVGYTSRWYADGRKREYLLRDLANHLDNRFFAFKFMGGGWDKIITLFRSKGFEVDYFPEFDLTGYKKLMSEIDYYLYTGLDEGQMGFVDALAAGCKTIVTPQGYHLDVEDGITHPFLDSKDLLKIFDDIFEEKAKRIRSVSDWTWTNYTLKHVEIWNHILGNEEKLLGNVTYNDGIHSILDADQDLDVSTFDVKNLKRKLYFHGLRRKVFVRFNYYTSKTFFNNLKRKLLKR